MKSMAGKSVLTLTALSLLAVPGVASAHENHIHIQIDGVEQSFESAPYLKNNRTLVPFRAILEKLGAAVQWDAATSTVTATKDGTVIKLPIGSQTGTIDGQAIPLDTAAEISGNRTMVPLRFVGEALGADVQWNAAASTVVITTGIYPPGLRHPLNLALTHEPESLDPAQATAYQTHDVINQIGEGLTRLDDNGRVVPGVASALDVSTDGMTYTYRLRDDAKWSDGSTVTAADFEYAWKRMVDPGTRSQYAFHLTDTVKGALDFNAGKGDADDVAVRAIDDRTLRIELTRPVPYFSELVTLPIFFPQKQSFVEAKGAAYGNGPANLLSNGPFKLTAWDLHNSLTVEKNLTYWDQKQVKLPKATFHIAGDQNALEAMYKAGHLDRFMVSSDQYDTYKDSKDLQVGHDLIVSYVNYNQKVPALQNALIRKALTYAVDAKTYAGHVYNNGSEAATGFVPTGVSNGKGGDYRKDAGDLIDRDTRLTQAKGMLAEGMKQLGLTEFPTLKLLVDDTATGRLGGEVLAHHWERGLGIQVELEPVSYKVRLQRTDTGDYDMAFALWGADYNDPMTFLDMWTTGAPFNHVGYSNAAYDVLIREAKAMPDAEKRMEMLRHAEEQLMADMPIGPVAFHNKSFVVKPYVKNLQTNSFFPSLDLKHTFVSGK
ncbi:ABC transporter substrate-binding protein [Tumebacillus sp. DT12]|uniref:ABC transporter substrate-binding protein n=1 Tax=Tumebacillus lacus TaxID=2995335 RepID=A0ABT3X241_9BACL|nr:ABC transporter substrate-binding protein [Tumebacillus lacus]MCX7570991.1 ABC transporter substrate-binding protein [Tumebacillus lacus]